MAFWRGPGLDPTDLVGKRKSESPFRGANGDEPGLQLVEWLQARAAPSCTWSADSIPSPEAWFP